MRVSLVYCLYTKLTTYTVIKLLIILIMVIVASLILLVAGDNFHSKKCGGDYSSLSFIQI